MNINRTIDRNFRAGANAIKSGNHRRAVQRLRKALDAMPGRNEFNWQRGAVYQLLVVAFNNLERHEYARTLVPRLLAGVAGADGKAHGCGANGAPG